MSEPDAARRDDQTTDQAQQITSTTDQDRREDEHTARTGEVQTDALGNEDGGS